MPNYFVTEYELQLIADKIREKGGTSAQLSFPQGFIDAIDALPSASAQQQNNNSPS